MIKNKKRENLKEKLNNVTEEVVLKMISELLQRDEFSDISKTEKDLLDMAAYALNRLPAKYVTSSKGKVFSMTEELEQQYSVDIISVVIQAIKVVSKNSN